MTAIPRVTDDCIVATVESASRVDPTRYAVEEMDRIAEEQPSLQIALVSVIEMFMKGLGEDGEEMISINMAKELALVSTFCSLGITMAAIKAQIEGDELTEQWKTAE
tara:strand:+ start:153 stop:473 length:321 start_codon:yes stop_codon:yes gene_type:complete